MKLFYSLIIFFILISNNCFADGYWIELEGSEKKNTDTVVVKIRYGGVNDEKLRYISSGEKLNKMKNFEASVITAKGEKIDIPLRQENDCWRGSFVPNIDGTYQIFAKNNQLPVVERECSLQNIKPVQYLNATYIVNKNRRYGETAPYMSIEFQEKNDTAMITPLIDGKMIEQGIELRVFLPNNEDLRLTTTADGKISFTISVRGLYLIRLDRYDDDQGIIERKRYYTVRHRYDYSLFI